MKKNIFLYGALAIGMMGMFAACSNEDEVISNVNEEEVDATTQVIKIAVENGSGLESRAGRPLNSEEADQAIENVLVVVTSESTIKYVDVIENWNTDEISTSYETNGHGREKEIKLEGTAKLDEGNYTVYAIGYHGKTSDPADSENDYNSDYKVGEETTLNAYAEGLKVGGTFNANLTLSTDKTTAEEIFAGSATLAVGTTGAGTADVVLHRQVAGVYTYIKEIPYMKDADMLRVVAVKNSKGLVLGNFKPETDLTANGTTPNTSNNVVNGSDTQDGETELYTIDLKEWFGQNLTADEDNPTLISKENWTVPEREKEGDRYFGCTFQVGSVYGGEFIIPFIAGSSSTLRLQLVNSNNKTTELRGWNINLSQKDVVTSGITYWSTDNWTPQGSTWTETATKYSILRNHLYGVGGRADDIADNDNPTEDLDPDDEDDPDTPDEDDKPESLNNKQELSLRVNDNWEVIHQMTID